MGPKRQCQIRPVPNGRATCDHRCSRLQSRACMLKEYRRPNFGSKAEPTVPSAGCACAINHRHGKHPCGPNVHQPPASYTGIAYSPASGEHQQGYSPGFGPADQLMPSLVLSRRGTASPREFPCLTASALFTPSSLHVVESAYVLGVPADGGHRTFYYYYV